MITGTLGIDQEHSGRLYDGFSVFFLEKINIASDSRNPSAAHQFMVSILFRCKSAVTATNSYNVYLIMAF